MSELAFGVWSRALIPLELPAYFELQPARVFAVQEAIHVYHGGHCWLKSQWRKTYAQLRGVPVHRPAAGASAPAPEHALLQATGRADASRTSHPQRTTTHNLMHTRTTDTLLRDSSRADYLLID